MYALIVRDGEVATGDARLVGDENDGNVGPVETSHRLGRPVQEMDLLRPREVVGVSNDRTVAVEKDDGRKEGHDLGAARVLAVESDGAGECFGGVGGAGVVKA